MTQIMVDVASKTIDWYQAEAEELGTTYLALIKEVLEWLPGAILAPAHVDDVTPLIPANSSQRVWFVDDAKLLQDNPFGGGF